ncbi:hypothetical protein [Allomuricauda sp. SCSIO 65647]|uniref:hypothetical protein n=1 Tax=Allomuricauda sp. SCSIO 65647 TaxID=2908843 RepID=UPI001F35E375|nr:hypothetical protein [Muricauda sp. SCSIO 65647]UJH66379.1 hypothetical protein L0P89_10410 [Muricauda sp. SCSIO 65647]
MTTISKKTAMRPYSTLFLVLILCALGTFSLKAQQSQLVGTWTFDADPSFSSIPADIQQHLDTLPSLKATVMAGYAGRTLVFMANGSFQQSLPNGATLSGNWSVSADNVLQLVHVNGHVLEQQITQLTSGTLVLLQAAEGDARPMVPLLQYTKN